MARPIVLALALALGVAASAAASSSIPLPPHYTFPSHIIVVGHDGAGNPDPLGRFEVVVHDVNGNPVANSPVYLDFTNCTDLRLCLYQASPGVIVRCNFGVPVLEAYTDATGRVEFDVMGSGTNTGGSPGPGVGCMGLFDESVRIANVTVSVLDQNGAVTTAGVEVTDLVAWLRDLGSGVYYGRSDYSGNGVVDIADLSILMKALGDGASSQGCSTLAPPGFCP